MSANVLGILFVLGVVGGNLLPPERSYKILMLLPTGTTSHRNVFMPLADALSDRGHEVGNLMQKLKAFLEITVLLKYE